jgi:tetratricopeptide (TPR) repeat protein
MNCKSRNLWAAAAIAVVVGLLLPRVLGIQRLRRAIEAYEAAAAAYMFYDVDQAKQLFKEVAAEYGDLPLGDMAELKYAFLVYDEDGDRDGARELFERFDEAHPDPVLHLPQTPQRFEYFGDVRLVAWYFLGRISQDEGNAAEARAWFEKVEKTGSRNPSNFILAESTAILGKMAPAD